MKEVHTRLHKVLPLIEDEKMRTLLTSAPLYVFSHDIAKMLIENESSVQSIVALVKAGLAHLPYPEMVVQFGNTDRDSFWFIHYKELQDGRFKAGGTGFRIIDNALYGSKHFYGIVEMYDTGFNIEGNIKNELMSAKAMGIGLRLAILMKQISGIERLEHLIPEALNKQRLKRGKSKILNYSYVHVAKVMDKDGKLHDRQGSGRHMPIHLRAGHTRSQHYGKGLAEVKQIWIAPVVVNYKGDDKESAIKKIGKGIEKRVVR